MKLLLSPLSIGQLVCTGELVKIASLLKWTPDLPLAAAAFPLLGDHLTVQVCLVAMDACIWLMCNECVSSGIICKGLAEVSI